MSLATAVQKLEEAGFGRYVKALRTEAVAAVALSAIKKRLGITMRWYLEDFELVLGEWSGLDDDARTWLAKEFLRFWQSRAGEDELRAGGGVDKQYGKTLLRFKTIWSHGGPAVRNLKLDPAKAIGLGWGYKEVEELLCDYVDVTCDCATLVEDLLQAEHLKPQLVSAHEGLLSACIDVCPDFLVGKMLVGQISLPGQGQLCPPRPPQTGPEAGEKSTKQG